MAITPPYRLVHPGIPQTAADDAGMFLDKSGDMVMAAPIFDFGGAVFNVKHPKFGAVGDGVADDATAIRLLQAADANVLLFPSGKYAIGSTITLNDHQLFLGTGPSPSANNGVEFVAGSGLGTDPMFEKTSGNLTRGGFQNIMFTGTNDSSGGDCISLSGTTAIADFWSLDNVHFRQFTGAGLKIVPDSGSIAGNPLELGFLKFVDCGIDGTSYGLHIERPNIAIVRIRFLSGDNNGAGLFRLKTGNSLCHIQIDQIQAERTRDGEQDNIIVFDTANAALLSIGRFWIKHNVSSGTNANAFIKETGGTTLRVKIEHCYYEELGSNNYAFGFDDGTTQVTVEGITDSIFRYKIPEVYASVVTLANGATPSVVRGNLFKTGGTTPITDFDDGIVGQTIQILSAHTVTITDGTPIILAGGADFDTVATDTLTLTMFDDQVWQEVSRSVN